MVFCCIDDALAADEEKETSSLSASAYPGNRRFAKTAGNAIKAAPKDPNVVQVTIPAGVQPGQIIRVKSPDGARMTQAQVPMGLTVGDTFQVRFPEQRQHENKPFTLKLDQWLTPSPSLPEVMATPIPTPDQVDNGEKLDRLRQKKREKEQTVVAAKHMRPVAGEPVHASVTPVRPYEHADEERRDQPEVVQVETSPSFAKTLEDFFMPTPDPPLPSAPAPATSHAAQSSSSRSQTQPQPAGVSSTQKVMLVYVPPGLPAGSSMQVEVPGENRTLSVTVPSGVSSFHVAYQATAAAAPRPSSPLQNWFGSSNVPPHVGSTPIAQPVSASPPSQKLLLVRVPPGTAPGATLHVSVPDEPGRILAAQVPPGNVTQFHVAYEPRSTTTNSQRYLPPASAYHASYDQEQPNYHNYHQQRTHLAPQYTPQPRHVSPPPSSVPVASQRPVTRQSRGAPPKPETAPKSNSFADFFLPFLGTVAAGAAGAATYDHFSSHNGNSGVDADGDYDAVGGDEDGNWGVDF